MKFAIEVTVDKGVMGWSLVATSTPDDGTDKAYRRKLVATWWRSPPTVLMVQVKVDDFINALEWAADLQEEIRQSKQRGEPREMD